MSTDFIKLMEIAGTLQQHVKDEKKLFTEVRDALKRLEKFAAKQHEGTAYAPIRKAADELCTKLDKHLERYCAK